MATKSIEIITTQNVSITYELASSRDRIVAFILDVIIKSGGLMLLSILVNSLPYDLIESLGLLILYFVYLPVAFFLWLAMEIFMNGQTLGKRAMKIKVVKLNGKQPDLYDYLLRWSFRIADIYLTLGLPAVLLIDSTAHSQRLGDIMANTTVVRTSNRLNVKLKDLMRIERKQDYEVRYPAIKNASEQDMLLLKSILEQFQKHKNAAHWNAVLAASEKMQEFMGLQELPQDRLLFLRTLIKDYVVLTR
jgi:uncharacterized RDD family membrane protein YckC